MNVHVCGIFVAVSLNREQIFYMCGIYLLIELLLLIKYGEVYV